MEEKNLQIIIDQLLMNANEFAKTIGVSVDTIYHILKGRNKLSPSVKRKILETYPNISKNWFESGEGEMFTWKEPSAIVKDPGIKYEMSCGYCKEKDKEIAELKDRLLESQQLYIELLKEVSAIRKASSG
jgi:DNA-binding XRE family transcriptional regulator